jgi:hypothetical protein
VMNESARALLAVAAAIVPAKNAVILACELRMWNEGTL